MRRIVHFSNCSVSGQDPRRHQTEDSYGSGEEADQVDQEKATRTSKNAQASVRSGNRFRVGGAEEIEFCTENERLST